ncbi:MAG: type II toxin-antitoxin system RelE/ParE family toxin [Candidatus Omnitrophota bacterium]
MNYQIIIRPEAEKDLSESYRWYQEKVPGLGSEFLRCVDSALDLITKSPKLYQEVYKNIRRAIIHRFPYEIFYVIKGDTVIVLAVFHAKRNPKILEKRTSK